MSAVRTNTRVPSSPFRLLRLALIGMMAMLILTLAANSALAQTPAPAAPANLTAELTDTEGEVLLSWDTAEGATSYRACRRVQDPPSGWSCVNRTTTSALFTGLAVDTAYDFAVASYDGQSYSSWVWTEATVEALAPQICPITGLPIPEGGYLAVDDVTTASNDQLFMLTEITRQSSINLGGTDYAPFQGRQYVKVCGAVRAPEDYGIPVLAGYHNNLSTDSGLGFVTSDDDTTDWFEVGDVPAGEVRRGCDIWEVPADATTVIYAINNFNAEAALYQVRLPEN